MRNNGDGTFSNVIDSAAPLHLDHLRDDTHGAAWADFDGDGDEDLLEVSGGGAGSAATGNLLESYYNNFWVNSGGVLSEQAQVYGIGYPRGRSRTPLWLDYDRDGALDVVITAVQSLPTEYPSAIFRQTASGFVDRTVATGFDAGSCYYGMLSDLSGDGEHDLVCANVSRVQAIYDIAAIPFSDLRADLGEDLYSIYPGDLAMGDFNGDLAVDVFTSKVPPSLAAAVQVGSERIHASLPASALEQGFSFAASGDVRIEFGWVTERADIFLGSGAVAPPVDSDPGLIEPDSRPHHVQLVLSAAEPTHLGLPAVRNAGIYLGLVAGRWQVRAVNVGAAVEVVVQAAAVSGLQAVGAVALDQGSPGVPILFVNQGGVLVQSTTAAAFRDPAAAISSYMRSFVAGDFDNDMDLDVYVGASGRVANVDNLLFDNQGDGTFRLAANAGGAAGSPLGATDSVTTVDYDRDGFLDLFVTQGNFPAPVAYSGVQQLFRNQGNANHWIELDLEGTASNPHGIGATVLARTPDGRVQLREQGNGMHRYSQSHRRIHFGLGPNQQVSLEVRWPSGVVDQFANLATDRVYALVEGSGIGIPPAPKNADRVGVWRPVSNQFFFDLNGNYEWDSRGDDSASFGSATDLPVIGDWNGDGADDIGVWRPDSSTFFLDANGNDTWDSSTDRVAPFGLSTDLPVVGDWNGDGVDDIGVWRPASGTFFLDMNGNRVWDPSSDRSASFGISTDLPVVGDWNADGTDDIGVWRPGSNLFLLDRNGNFKWDVGRDISASFGLSTDLPVSGDWNGDGADEIGIWRPDTSSFFLDVNGNYRWDVGVDLSAPFGVSADLPVTGRW